MVFVIYSKIKDKYFIKISFTPIGFQNQTPKVFFWNRCCSLTEKFSQIDAHLIQKEIAKTKDISEKILFQDKNA